MRATSLLAQNYPVKLHNKMVHVHLESICIHADAALFLSEMFDPRSAFYALSIAWDFSEQIPTIYGNLPLQLSYKDTRKYDGVPLLVFEGHHIVGSLNLAVFAYQYDGKRLQHKKFLQKINTQIQALFTEKTIISKDNIEACQTKLTEKLYLYIADSLASENINAINIFKGLIGVEALSNQQKSTIKHYHKMGEIKLTVKV